jgi:hypothetical protein
VPYPSIPKLLLLTCIALPIHAASLTWIAAHTDPTSEQPVNVSSVFSTQPGTMTIQLSNLEMNPVSDSQNLSGLFFTLEDSFAGITLASAMGDLATIAESGKITNLGAGNLNSWTLISTTEDGKTNVQLTMLGKPHATETIIGPADSSTGDYTAANRSISGSVHNPFVLSNATFTISASGLSTTTVVNAVTFGFGTSAGDYVLSTASGLATGNAAAVLSPEPISALLLFSGLVMCVMRMRPQANPITDRALYNRAE